MEKYGYGVIRPGGDGNIPILYASGATLAEGWQNAMLALNDFAIEVPTSFDREGDPNSRDATVIMSVDDLLAEPRLHKLGLPCTFVGLEHYRLEVTHGVHNHWVNRFGTEWNYTYNERMEFYRPEGVELFNQREGLMEMLVKEAKKGKLYRRRFQMTTWIPPVDQVILDPPCLQRIWIRFIQTDEKSWKMNVNTDWRSRDGFKAMMMNIYALSEYFRLFAAELSERTGLIIELGSYSDKSDSLHIYGQYMIDGEAMAYPPAVKRMKEQPFEDLALRADEQLDEFVEARRILQAQLLTEKMDPSGSKAFIDPSIKVSELVYPTEWDM